jgi:chromate reductase, NAD(P)H dehydrogenase (quinone)
MRVLGISGSLRRDSYNSRLLRGARKLLPAEVELVTFDRLAAIPPYNEDEEGRAPGAVAALRAAVSEADALLLATPEYNGSLPGQLKNALDWVSRPIATSPLRGKPAAVVGASTGLFGAVWAQAELRKVLATIGARVLDRELPIADAGQALDEEGLPRDRAQLEQLSATLDELLERAGWTPREFTGERPPAGSELEGASRPS